MIMIVFIEHIHKIEMFYVKWRTKGWELMNQNFEHCNYESSKKIHEFNCNQNIVSNIECNLIWTKFK